MNMKSTSGYQGPSSDDKKVDPPNEVEWLIKERQVGGDSEDDDTVYAAFEADGEVLGMVRLPNPEYLRWLRERIQK
jgi:hypothetical protein